MTSASTPASPSASASPSGSATTDATAPGAAAPDAAPVNDIDAVPLRHKAIDTVLAIAYAALVGFSLYHAVQLVRLGRKLHYGGVTNPSVIVPSMLVLNGISLVAFRTRRRSVVRAHSALHILLAGDELVRTAQHPHRFPLLLDQIAMALVIEARDRHTSTLTTRRG